MEESQSFRVTGEKDVEEIACDQVDGQNVIYWEDIEHVFPTVKHVKNGNINVKLLRDSKRIRFAKGVHWGTRKATSDQTDKPTNTTAILSTVDNVVEALQITPPAYTPRPDNTSTSNENIRTSPDPPMPLSASPPTNAMRSSKVRLSFKDVVKLAQKKHIESHVEQQMVSSLPLDVQEQVRASENVHDSLVQVIKDGRMDHLEEQLVACMQSLNRKMVENNALASRIMDLVVENHSKTLEIAELTACVIKLQETLGAKQDEMTQLQMKALDRLAILQNGVKSLLNQTYELHEYPIPRLFIVLPKDSSSWDPLDLFSNKFQLYFLCECGEHTKSTNSKIPHHIHIAKHEGYAITRPNEFFRQYGSYVLTILRMLKFGITAAGVAIPALSQLVQTDAMDQATTTLKDLMKTIEPGVDQVIGYIEKISEDEGEPLQEFEEQLTNSEALEGADLRQLETFLKNKDENRVLGNLYRTVTTEGHVKWVCIDHYRENYQEKAARAFRDTVDAMNGKFYEDIGRVEVDLGSRLQADQFYLALEKARSVYELKVTFNRDWDTTQGDFRRLRDALAKTNVGILELVLGNSEGPNTDILNRNQRYDPIFGIMRHPSIQSVSFITPPLNLIKRSSLLTRKDDFRNLRQLSFFEYQMQDDVLGLKCLAAKARNLTSLTFRGSKDPFLRIYNAISEHQTFSVNFPDEKLCIYPPKHKSRQPMGDLKDKAEFLKILGGRIDNIRLSENELTDAAVADFVTALEAGSQLQGLTLEKTEQHLSEQCVKDIAGIVTSSKLSTFTIYSGEDAGRVRILESIQWEHLRKLVIIMDRESLWADVMKALVDGVKSKKIKLENFQLLCSSDNLLDSILMSEEELLPMFLASTALSTLALQVEMSSEQALSWVKSFDCSRMQEFRLLGVKGFDSAAVEAMIECLQDATELRLLHLKLAKITEEQKKRMEAKGVTLTSYSPQ
ncbi:hypothetical protein BGX34_006094 [Mortierella sp. NVP85]|nr:hypothetical protein BGX34_006094 [Mortierella sp. NVP85]